MATIESDTKNNNKSQENDIDIDVDVDIEMKDENDSDKYEKSIDKSELQVQQQQQQQQQKEEKENKNEKNNDQKMFDEKKENKNKTNENILTLYDILPLNLHKYISYIAKYNTMPRKINENKTILIDINEHPAFIANEWCKTKKRRTKLNKPFHKKCRWFIERLKCHNCYFVFAQPVDSNEVPGVCLFAIVFIFIFIFFFNIYLFFLMFFLFL